MLENVWFVNGVASVIIIVATIIINWWLKREQRH